MAPYRLQRAAAMASRTNRYNKMGSLLAVLFPSLSLLSTEFSYTKAYSRTGAVSNRGTNSNVERSRVTLRVELPLGPRVHEKSIVQLALELSLLQAIQRSAYHFTLLALHTNHHAVLPLLRPVNVVFSIAISRQVSDPIFNPLQPGRPV